MNPHQIETPVDTRSRAERRRPAPKTYRAINHRRIKCGKAVLVTQYVRASHHNGGERLPRLAPDPSRSRYEPHVGEKQLEKAEDRRICALPLESYVGGPGLRPMTPAQVEAHI